MNGRFWVFTEAIDSSRNLVLTVGHRSRDPSTAFSNLDLEDLKRYLNNNLLARLKNYE